ncbi:Zinc-finger domain-containing protein [Phanerochaete sordida]|uniref:Zinc-finger domain-containing protein n=1 Tax=Phanerochaete sordida TaxID=48140 RepID=A0A9P3LC43_9APHY|nr:Zinc-finger domain-containing protein [Phanerochaete sordida]
MASHTQAGYAAAGGSRGGRCVDGSSAAHAAAAQGSTRRTRTGIDPSGRAAGLSTPPSERGATGTAPASPPPPGSTTAPSVWAPPSLFASSLALHHPPQCHPLYKGPVQLPLAAPPTATSAHSQPLPYALHLYSAHPASYYPASSMAIPPAPRFEAPADAQPFDPHAALPAQQPQPVLPALSAPDEPRRSSSPSSSEHDDETKATRPKKRHACIMCHKSFDRPSTLKKHLLVHTGERAYECTNCNRRFSVGSNLRRHQRRCVPATEAPSASESTMAGTSEGSNAPEQAPSAAPSSSASAGPSAPMPRGRKRRTSTPDAPTTPSTAASSSTSTADAPRPKRRRRAPSPSRWVPESLRAFDLTPYAKATPVPLPPVAPHGALEERDSFVRYDARAGARLYHPSGWTGRLPGPALLEPEGLGGAMGARMLII